MKPEGVGVLVTGGASGLGLASARLLSAQGARVTIADRESSHDAETLGVSENSISFVHADVRSEADIRHAVRLATEVAPLRVVIHTAGRGGPLRILGRDGTANPLETFKNVVDVNLVGSYNVLSLASEAMAANEPLDEERGVVVLTSSIAAFEGRTGQVHYAASKAGVVGMTLTAARDLASRKIRVATIAPGTFDTPMLSNLSDDIRRDLAAAVPHPARLGRASEFAALALHIVENPMINGEVIRLDGALRMSS